MDGLKVLEKLVEKDIHFQLSWTGNEYKLLLCRANWWTNHLGASVPLPCYMRPTIAKVLKAVVDDGWLKK